MQNQSIHNQSVQKIKEKKNPHQEQLHGVSQEACMENQEEETLEIQLQLHDLIARDQKMKPKNTMAKAKGSPKG